VDNVLRNSDITYFSIVVKDKEEKTLPLHSCLDFVSDVIQQCILESEIPYNEQYTLLVHCHGAHSRSLLIAAASIKVFSTKHHTLSNTLELIVFYQGLESIYFAFCTKLITFYKNRKEKKRRKSSRRGKKNNNA